MKDNFYRILIGFTTLSCVSTIVHSHGWSEFPSARQNICYEQGGIWSGNPPNAACAKAKDISGTYQFLQRNEFSKNIIDFRNMEAVKAAIPNGTLCYANDPQKKGIGISDSSWTRTELKAGTFEYVFNATAPHNPSFWEFYITKSDANLSKPLAWEDLELIQREGNVPINGGKYRIDVTLPSERIGDAILFVRWQRDDAAGEGFYNCSDITIISDDFTPPVESVKGELVKGELFIPYNFTNPNLGDLVNYDILDLNGQTIRTFDLMIDAENLNDWDRVLASKINGWHAEFKDGAIFIGDWHEEMSHYMYFKNNVSGNFFNSKDPNLSGAMRLVKHSEEVEKRSGLIYELVESDNVVNAGDKVIIDSGFSANLSQTQGTNVVIEDSNSSYFIIDTSIVNENETLTFLASSLDGNRSNVFTFEVVANNSEGGSSSDTSSDTIEDNDWSSEKIYLGGEVVHFSGKYWKAQWWTQGGDNPSKSYQDDIWGVWRPLE